MQTLIGMTLIAGAIVFVYVRFERGDFSFFKIFTYTLSGGGIAPTSGVVRQQPTISRPSQATTPADVAISVSRTDPAEVRIYASGAGTPVNVTGWRIESKRGAYTIPNMIESYTGFGLEQKNDVILRGGDTLNIYAWNTGNGQSFRLNKCIGYLQRSFTFSPSLPGCPALYGDRREIAHFSSRCQDIITSLSSCAVPTVNAPVGDYACQEFLNDINYGSCYRKHAQDDDFLSREWRLWIGDTVLVDARHDLVKLIDTAGNVVDDYIY